MVLSYEDEDDDLMVVSLLRHSYDRFLLIPVASRRCLILMYDSVYL